MNQQNKGKKAYVYDIYKQIDLFSYVFSRRIKTRLFLNELCFHDINGFKFIVTQMMVINFKLSFEMDLFLIL